MTLRQLRYFLEIAQLRSFTRASEVLHVAQPALSRQVRALEDELGMPLFNRVDRGVELTEAGERLRMRAERLLCSFDQLYDEVINDAATPYGELAVGVPPSLREMISVPLIGTAARRFPDVKLHVHEGISLDLERAVQQGRIECALVIDLETSRSLACEFVLREQLFLIGPAAAGLRPHTPTTLDEVVERDLILTMRPNSLRLIIENALARTRKPYRIVADFNATGLMIELVADDMAYSVLPYSAAWAAYRRGDLSLAPIDGLSIDWVVISRRELPQSLAAAKFRELLHEVVQTRIDAGEWFGVQQTDDA